MANTLTGLIPTVYTALDVVSREQIGFILNVNRDAKASQGAVGQTVRSPVVPAASFEDITPGATRLDRRADTIGYADVTINKSAVYLIRLDRRGTASVNHLASTTPFWLISLLQAFRTIANAVEVDLAAEVCERILRLRHRWHNAVRDCGRSLIFEINRILMTMAFRRLAASWLLTRRFRAKLEGKHS